MFGLLVEMENPAITPKPLGKSTCWEAGKVRSKKTRKLVLFATYEAVKKVEKLFAVRFDFF